MKKILKYIAVTGLASAMLVSCNMDLVPIDSITYEEGGQLISTQTALNALENGMLTSFRSLQMGEFSITSELMMDGFNATLDYGNNYGGIHRVTSNDFTSGDYYVEDYWQYNYAAIKNYNIYIAAAENVPEDLQDAANVVLGEAYFFRAMSYLNLARHFGKAYNAASAETDLCVPKVEVYDQLDKPARATVKDIYDFIKSDLDNAATLLANVKGVKRPVDTKDAAKATKPTIDAVNALYARYYIDIANYAKAAEYVNDAGTEPIFQVYTNKSSEGSNANSLWTYYTADNNKGKVFKPYYIPTQKLMDCYEATDLRLAAWFDNAEWVQLNGSYYQGDFYIFTKYWGNPALTSALRNGRQCPKPLMIGEMYLIAAEAELSTDPAAAKTDLNALQTSRGASATEATTETVRNEWFKETVGEGLRMVTMKRWGLGYNGRPMQPGAANALNQGENYELKNLPATDHHFCWPVPSHEMNINKNLIQNPGYADL